MRIGESEAPRDDIVGYGLLKYLIVKYAVTAGVRVGGAVDAHADARALVVEEDARKLIGIIIVYLLTDMIRAVLFGIDILADMGEHGYSALASHTLRRGLIVAVNAGKTLAIVGIVAGQMAVALRGRHIELYALRDIEHTIIMCSRLRCGSAGSIGLVLLIGQRIYGRELRALVFDEPYQRHELRLLIPALVYRAVVCEREDIVVEVIVSLNDFVDRQIAVARVALSVQLSLVYSPAVPIDIRIRVGYLVAYLRRGCLVLLRKGAEHERRHRNKQAEQPRQGAFEHCHSSVCYFFIL